MQTTPKGLRLQIAILGEVNSGKSTFLNLMTGQEAAIVSPIAGTTTDVVEKAQEMHPLGPVLWMDTAGFDDKTNLAQQRIKKTMSVLQKADIAVVVSKNPLKNENEEKIITLLKEKNIPFIDVLNVSDDITPYVHEKTLVLNAQDLSQRSQALHLVEKAILDICPEDFLTPPAMLGDLVKRGGLVVMIVPIDFEAPKGRLILPQVQAIRDCLDHDQMIMVVKENQYLSALENLKTKPDLVVCDSQVVKFMVNNTPSDILCTTFSILMARLKGDLSVFVEGAKTIETLKDGDKILISESCTHHAADDDIGTVKIPHLMKLKTGKNLIFEHTSGCDFNSNLKDYRLIVQCGGCTQNRKAILSRIALAQASKTPITNYGICLSALNGVLPRVLEPFL